MRVSSIHKGAAIFKENNRDFNVEKDLTKGNLIIGIIQQQLIRQRGDRK